MRKISKSAMYNEKQLQIISTAENLFAKKGFDGTSVRDIAEEAGVNIAMISYYFGSKDKLMQALFEERTAHIRMRVETLLKDDATPPLEKVCMLVDDYIERVFQRQKFYKIMICEQVMEKNALVTSLLKELKLKNAETIGLLIQDGQSKGAFRPDVDVMLLMQTMIGTISQMFINQDYYRSYHGLDGLDEAAFQQTIRKKLSDHIKYIFKAILTYEAS